MSTSKLDSQNRIVLPSGQPGDVFDVQQQGDRGFLLLRIEAPQPVKHMSREACIEAMQKAPLRPTISWDHLRQLTREP